MRTVNRLTGLGLDRRALRPASRWDVLLAVFASLVYLASVAGNLPAGHSPLWWVGVCVWSISLISIAWRTRAAWVVLILSLTAAIVQMFAGGPIADIAVLVALYTIGVQETWRRAAIGWALSVIVITAAAAPTVLQTNPTATTGGTLIPIGSELTGVAALLVSSAFIFAVPTAVGLWLGARRAYVRTLLERTADLERERDLLERERDLQARQAVAVERARIARELHDVVAHHVSVMVIQAGAAEGTVPAEDAAARQALGTIGRTGREAMAEMRRLLGVLRTDGAGYAEVRARTAGTTTDDRAPQPGLGDLPALLTRVQEAGVKATCKISGHPRALPRAVDLSAYRIVQEALTNTLRHAGPGARARVEIRYESRTLVVEVRDDGGRPGAAKAREQATGPGHGIVGMRERAVLFGGTLEAGPVRGGGFRVCASFPVDEWTPEDELSGAPR